MAHIPISLPARPAKTPMQLLRTCRDRRSEEALSKSAGLFMLACVRIGVRTRTVTFRTGRRHDTEYCEFSLSMLRRVDLDA